MRKGVLDSVTVHGVTYLLKRQNCNKPRCTRCPHGPYWYKELHIGKGRTILKYHGKNPPGLPEQVEKMGSVLTRKVCPECGTVPTCDTQGIWTCPYCPWWGEHPRIQEVQEAEYELES